MVLDLRFLSRAGFRNFMSMTRILRTVDALKSSYEFMQVHLRHILKTKHILAHKCVFAWTPLATLAYKRVNVGTTCPGASKCISANDENVH